MIGGGLAARRTVAAGDNEGARSVQTVASRPASPDDRIPLSAAGASVLRSHLAPCRAQVVPSVRTPPGSGSYSKSTSKSCPFEFYLLVRSGLYAIVMTVRGVGQGGRMVGETTGSEVK